ncbi:MAG: murein transglycosylase domain-containing protein [Nitrospirota bacterium]|nr:murein transglycosylase domain-containing protein [Nitrospirota bacterium]MDP2382261.1 murein transglycosylase domain-containing protein [Nitrospirota bacterium]
MRPPTSLATLLIVTLAFATAGCETTDQILTAAERVTRSRTGQTVIDLAGGKDPAQVAKQRIEQYARDPEALIRDLRAAKKDFETLLAALGVNVGKTWGKEEVKLPEQKKYVKYTQNYKSRAIVDFDAGEILVETLDEQDPQRSLKNALVTTILTPEDPRAVDLFSDKEIVLTGDKMPYLYGLVLDQQRKPVRTPAEAEPFAAYILEKKSSTRVIDQDGAKKTAHYVKIPMVSNLAVKQADKYRTLVHQFAEQYRISPSLVFAVIRTESNFNPYAVSSAPAYGLMQLVPTSGGREAYRKAKGQDVTPTREYLFDPANNLELGTAYLNVLMFNQLESVAHNVSREYCVIAAYNTGAGNVFRTFSRTRTEAINQINSLQPAAVYDQLREKLPYEETRQYLGKVTGYRKAFINSSESPTQ